MPSVTMVTESTPAPAAASTSTFESTTPSLFSLVGKVIIVTGAARGLGLAQAEALLECGATVHALDILPTPSPAFQRIQAKALALHTSLTYHPIDVTDAPATHALIAGIATAHSGIHGLIAAAGIQHEHAALDFPADACTALLAINVTGVLTTAQAAARAMIAHGVRGGSIALIASMSGSVANRGLRCAPYNASKAAVQQLGRSLAAEWGECGIRVNTISPGYIATEMVEGLLERFPERRVQWPMENMLGRLGGVGDFRGVAVFLMAEGSAWMTGSDVRIDGGHAAW